MNSETKTIRFKCRHRVLRSDPVFVLILRSANALCRRLRMEVEKVVARRGIGGCRRNGAWSGAGRKGSPERGFTLVEVLVTIAIIAVIAGIVIPALTSVRRQAINLVSMNNQKQITSAINIFSNDHSDQYPESVATIGYGENWNWTDPTRMTGNRQRSPRLYRSMSQYLRDYIGKASTMFCPCSPSQYQYLQQSWDAGENWDNPETAVSADPVGGSYCFWWNYKGVLEQQNKVFQGPQDPVGGRRQSKLLITDYFGYNDWRSPEAFGSCELFNGATEVSETLLLSSFWSAAGSLDIIPDVTLRAGYSDGHVETFSSRETVQMKVSITSDGRTPYPDGVGPGIYFLPTKALQQ